MSAAMTIGGSLNASTWYAAPEDRGNADGSSAPHAMELQAALNTTREAPAEIVLVDGTYRGEYSTWRERGVPLTLRAENPGRAVFSGADRMQGWEQVDEDGRWRLHWPAGWKPSSGTFPSDAWHPSVVERRREVVFLDGVRLRQVTDPDDPARPAGHLEPGEYTVDDAMQTLTIRLRKGVDPNVALTEVSLRGARPANERFWEESVALLAVMDCDDLTIEGLVFQRSANSLGGPAALVVGRTANSPDFARNVTVRNSVFKENNGVGFSASRIDGLRVEGCRFIDNGQRGAGMGQVLNAVWEDCVFEGNNWRSGRWMINWDAAGLKTFDGAETDSWFVRRSDNIVFRRCTFRANHATGFWIDYGATNVLLERCLVENNAGSGVFVEVTPGPVRIHDSIIRRNGNDIGGAGGNLTLCNSPDVQVRRTAIYSPGPRLKSGRPANIRIMGDKRRADDTRTYQSIRTVIEDSVVLADSPGARLMKREYWVPGQELGYDPADVFIGTLQVRRNLWFQEGDDPAFYGPADNREDPGLRWEEWPLRCEAGAWENVDKAKLDALDPTVPGPYKPFWIRTQQVPHE